MTPKRREPYISKSNLYKVWSGMIQRCNNPKNDRYRFYGARGVRVCDEWLTFANFYNDMAPRPQGTTLDRINPEGNYCKENCRWATDEVQKNNCRSTVWVVDKNGERMSLSQWCRKYKVSYDTMHRRITIVGQDPQKAVETPIRKMTKRNRVATLTDVTN